MSKTYHHDIPRDDGAADCYRVCSTTWAPSQCRNLHWGRCAHPEEGKRKHKLRLPSLPFAPIPPPSTKNALPPVRREKCHLFSVSYTIDNNTKNMWTDPTSWLKLRMYGPVQVDLQFHLLQPLLLLLLLLCHFQYLLPRQHPPPALLPDVIAVRVYPEELGAGPLGVHHLFCALSKTLCDLPRSRQRVKIHIFVILGGARLSSRKLECRFFFTITHLQQHGPPRSTARSF